MNVCFILVLSASLQILFSYILDVMFPGLGSVAWFSYLRIIVSGFLCVFLPAYYYLKNEGKPYFTDFAKGVKFSPMLLAAAAIGICGQFAGMLVNLPVNILIYHYVPELESRIPDVLNFTDFILAAFSLCLIPALFEEILFRGAVFNYFRKYGNRSAVVISALLFSIMHMDFANLLGPFLLGLIFGLLVMYTNRIIFSVVAHFCVNLCATFIKYLLNFEMLENFYSDYIFAFMLISIPLAVYLLKLIKSRFEPLPYCDQDKHIFVTERIFEIDETNSIKIIEHDIRENNLKLAFKKLFLSPHIYILILLLVYIGGSAIWRR